MKLKCTLRWSNLYNINEMSGKYQVDLCNLSTKAVEALAKEGIEAKESGKSDDERGVYITCKSTYPIATFDADGDEISSALKVGNGTTAEATIKPYAWDFKGKKGVSATISHLKITKLIEYNSGEDSEEVGVAI